MAARRALITGIAGQDGSLLAEQLLADGYEVFGVVRRPTSEQFENLDAVLAGDARDQRAARSHRGDDSFLACH
jgi:GDPmannose 4,6-dehydratase